MLFRSWLVGRFTDRRDRLSDFSRARLKSRRFRATMYFEHGNLDVGRDKSCPSFYHRTNCDGSLAVVIASQPSALEDLRVHGVSLWQHKRKTDSCGHLLTVSALDASRLPIGENGLRRAVCKFDVDQTLKSVTVRHKAGAAQ